MKIRIRTKTMNLSLPVPVSAAGMVIRKIPGLRVRQSAKKRAGAVTVLFAVEKLCSFWCGNAGNASHDPQSGDYTYRDGGRDVHFH